VQADYDRSENRFHAVKKAISAVSWRTGESGKISEEQKKRRLETEPHKSPRRRPYSARRRNFVLIIDSIRKCNVIFVSFRKVLAL
jgi:hypothetical protein